MTLSERLGQLKESASRWVQATASRPRTTSGAASYKVVDASAGQPPDPGGWRAASVARAQHEAYSQLLIEMRTGHVREDFRVAAEAIDSLELQCASLLEVGCGTGYYYEVLRHLLRKDVHYTGLDYSYTMVRAAAFHYPNVPFVNADAVGLPFIDSSVDIVLNGVSLMHIPNYETAITEAARVSRRWCIFHTVPVMSARSTTVLSKNAYGKRVIEIVFNEAELLNHFDDAGLVVRSSRGSIPYDLREVIGVPTRTTTYVCEKKLLEDVAGDG